MKKQRKDVGASVRARLLRLAQEHGDDFQLMLTRYANERLLYRLAASPHGSPSSRSGRAGRTGRRVTSICSASATRARPASERSSRKCWRSPSKRTA